MRRPPTHNAESNILGPLNVDACLSHHRDSVNAARERAEIKPITDALITSAQATSFSAGVPDEHLCGTCKEARVTCADLIDKLRQAQAYAATMKSASVAEADLARREIAGAHLFGETVLLKESALPDKNTPQESQWQFGAALTREDVLQLKQADLAADSRWLQPVAPQRPIAAYRQLFRHRRYWKGIDLQCSTHRSKCATSPTFHTLPTVLDTIHPAPESPRERYRRIWFARRGADASARQAAGPSRQPAGPATEAAGRQYFVGDDSDDEVEVLSRLPSPRRAPRRPMSVHRSVYQELLSGRALPAVKCFSSSESDDNVSLSQRSPPTKRLRSTAVPSQTAVPLSQPIGRACFADSDEEMADGTVSRAAAPRIWFKDSDEDVASPPPRP